MNDHQLIIIDLEIQFPHEKSFHSNYPDKTIFGKVSIDTLW